MDDRSERVLVYRHDAQLVEAAGSFLCDALARGGAALAFASAEHMRALEDWVSLCGCDLGGAAEEGRYHAFAIDELLRSRASGTSAARAPTARLEAALARVPPDAAPLHVFGEVAQELRASSEEDAPVSFSALAQQLRAIRPMSLLLARHEDLPADEACARGRDAEALLEAPPFPAPIEVDNGAVVSSAVLPPAPGACRIARRLVRSACAGETRSDAVDSAELVVSELAGNAVRHARSTFKAEVLFRNGSMRLAVTDAKPLPDGWSGFPIAREHGLGLVAAVAEDWAVEPLTGGKVVWAELARDDEAG